MEELRGYLWPLQVFERVKGHKPGREYTITTVVFNGKPVRGVLLDESHGRPVGTIAIYGEDTRYVQKDSPLAVKFGKMAINKVRMLSCKSKSPFQC